MDIQWSLVIFTLLSGAGGWLLAAVALNGFAAKSKADPFRLTLIGLILVVLGGVASATHLSHPERIMNALSNPTSGIFVEAALVGAIAVCAIIALVLFKRGEGAAKAAKVFVLIAGVLGIVISFMAGESYTVMTGRAAWDTMLLPLAYLMTAAPIGLGLYWALACPDQDNGAGFFATLTAVTAAAGAVVTLAYCALAGLFGGEASIYGIAAVVLDIIAAAVAFVGGKKASAGLAWGAAVAAAIAGFLLRMLMWLAGGGVFAFFG